MSVILDALRKLDREKSSRRNGTANIAVEVIRPDLSRPGEKVSLYIAAISLTAIAAAAITYILMPEPGSVSKPSPPVPVILPAPSQQTDPLSREALHDAQNEMGRVPEKIETPAGSKPTEISSGEKKREQNIISEEAKFAPGITKKPDEPSAVESATTPPSLKISAIVWYEDPSKRFAMINGTISTEGSLVDGVKVVEIHPTGVRFFRNGQYFEIPISK